MSYGINASPVVVRNLCCKQHVPMAVAAFTAMRKLSESAVRFIIHDDGSLDWRDEQVILASVPDARIVRRQEADESVSDILAKYPLLLRARKDIAYFIKLLDILLIEPTPTTCYLDSDVLFLRPFSHLADLRAHGTRALFMADVQNAYGFRLPDFWPIGELRFARKLNSGLFAVSTGDVEIEYFDWILRKCGLEQARQHTGWFEQGAWAALGRRLGVKLFESEQIRLVTEPETLIEGPVGMHFTGRSRQRFKEFAERVQERREGEDIVCERLRSSLAGEYTALGALCASVSGRVSRWLGRKIARPGRSEDSCLR